MVYLILRASAKVNLWKPGSTVSLKNADLTSPISVLTEGFDFISFSKSKVLSTIIVKQQKAGPIFYLIIS